MKKFITLLNLLFMVTVLDAQQASDYFPAQTGFKWKFKLTPLDSASNPVPALSIFRIDSFSSVANYEGRMANIVETKMGPLQSITQQPYLDSLFSSSEGTNGYEYFSIRNIEEFLIELDSLGITQNFSFLEFFTSLQNWYSTYRFASNVGTEYVLIQKDTTIVINSLSYNFRFTYAGRRLQDQTIQTVSGNFNCKKFLLQWKIAYLLGPLPIELLTTKDTIWIAPGNWIVQDIIPGQYINNLTFLGIDPFSIPGLETKLTDEIVVSVAKDESYPDKFYLEQNYPNPFNPSTKIKFTISNVIASETKQSQLVTLKVYDILGKEVATVVNEDKPAGSYEVEFNSAGLPSGVYFYKLQASSFTESRKMVLLK